MTNVCNVYLLELAMYIVYCNVYCMQCICIFNSSTDDVGRVAVKCSQFGSEVRFGYCAVRPGDNIIIKIQFRSHVKTLLRSPWARDYILEQFFPDLTSLSAHWSAGQSL